MRVAAAAGTIVLLTLLVLSLLYTEQGARIAWQVAAKVLPGKLSGDVAGGTLAGGLALRNVVYEDANRRIHIDRLESAWRLTRSPLLLTIRFLSLGKVDVTLLPDPTPEPAAPLQEIRFPLAFDLQRLSVRQLLLHQEKSTTRFNDILLRASSDQVRHKVDLERAETPYGKAAATLRLNGLPPFELDATAGLDGRIRDQAFSLDAKVSGTLREPGIRLDATGAGLSAQAEIDAAPFAPVPLRRAEIHARNVDPNALNPAWPQAGLDIDATLSPVDAAAPPAGGDRPLTVAGPVSITNTRPGAINQDLLPLAAVRADVVLDKEKQQLGNLSITLPGKGSLTGSGELRGPNQGELTLQAKDVDLNALHTALRTSSLNGPLEVRLAGESRHVNLRLADRHISAVAEATLAPAQITLHTATLESGKARLVAQGALGRGDEAAYRFDGRLSEFNPALFFAPAGKRRGWQAPNARINMRFDAQGVLRPELRADLDFQVRDSSTYAGLPMTGGGTVRLQGKQMLPSDAQLSIAGNRIALKGSFGAPSDSLDLRIDAPALGRLGFGLSGLLRVDGRIAGTLDRPVIDAGYRAEKLAFGSYSAARLAGEAHVHGLPGTTHDARVALTLNASRLQGADIDLARLSADIDGTYERHTIELDAAGRLRGRLLDVRAAAQGRLSGLPQGMAWDGVLRTLENTGFPRLSMEDPMTLSLAPGRIALGSTRLTIEKAAVGLQGFRYTGDRIQSEGAFRALEIAHLLELQRQLTGNAPPIQTDLVLDGSWDLTLADQANGYAEITRRSGDLILSFGSGKRAAGLTALSARANLQGMRVALQAQVASTRFGKANGEGQIALQPVDGRLSIAPDAPVSGHVEATIPDLQALGFVTGPNISYDGRITVDLDIDGTLANPQVSGTANGEQLALTLFDQGIRLRDGTARLVLKDNIVALQQVEFHDSNGGGTMRATGSLSLDNAGESLQATITADNFQLLSNPSGRMTVSGQAQAGADGRQMRITGKFAVDRALFTLPERSPPRLDDDVVIIRDGKRVTAAGDKKIIPAGEQPSGPFSPRVNLEVDLGDDFRFEGSGAELRLAGTIEIRSAPGESPQAYGAVRVVEGAYEAFGAELAIERGVINFQGPLGNPNVNILAMRREQEVAAGVHVQGTVQRPRVQLVSEPNVPDEEKLSWLVFGSSGGGGGGPGQARAAATGAALGLLNKFGGERLAGGFGLDQLSIGESEFGLAGQQVVNLGKEISDRLFIGYEQSLAGAESVLKLTYELKRNWSVVLRGGAVTGIEVFFSKRFDRLR